MTTALVGGLLGLFGTALGATLTTWTARQTAERSERRAQEEDRRQEYRSAVIRFATALLEYRLAAMGYWRARQGELKEQEAAEREVYRKRATAWNAFYELELSTSSEITQLARSAIDNAHSIQSQDTEDGMSHYSYQARQDLAAMVASARAAQPGAIPGMEAVLSGG